MTVEYSYILNKREVRKTLLAYLRFVYAPWLFMDIALALILAAQLALQPRDPLPFICGFIVLLLVPAVSCFRYISDTIKTLETMGQLNREVSISLDDHELTSRFGKNTVSVEYLKMKYFSRSGQRLFLMGDKNILFGTIRLEKIPEHEAELIACLQADGVKELRFWSFSRWWKRVLIVLVAALLFFGTKYFLDYSSSAERELSQTEQE